MTMFGSAIATMRGPEFLKFYATSAVAVIATVWLFARRWDQTRHMPTPEVPESPDPYRIAYLRGGANEVIRLVVFNLCRKGFLKTTGGRTRRGGHKKISQSFHPPPIKDLDQLEKVVFGMATNPIAVGELFKHERRAIVEAYTDHHLRDLSERSLLRPARHLQWSQAIRIGALGLLTGLAAYKIVVALQNGHYNIGFLLLMLAAALPLTWWAGSATRITDCGRRYHDALKSAFNDTNTKMRQASQDAASKLGLLYIALNGTSLLKSTEYKNVHNMFDKARKNDFTFADCGSCGDFVFDFSGGGSSWTSCAGSSISCGSGCGGGGCGGGCGGCGGG